MVHIDDEKTIVKFFDSVHSIPKYETYTNVTLIFKIKYFLCMLPNNHEY